MPTGGTYQNIVVKQSNVIQSTIMESNLVGVYVRGSNIKFSNVSNSTIFDSVLSNVAANNITINVGNAALFTVTNLVANSLVANVANITTANIGVLGATNGNFTNLVAGGITSGNINVNFHFANLINANTIGSASLSSTTASFNNVFVQNCYATNMIATTMFGNATLNVAVITTPSVINRITRNGKWVTPYILAGADHNCANDGVTDTTTNMANAVVEANATGRELYFEPGYYNANCAAFIAISTSGVHIKGAGRNSTIIRNTHTSGNTFTFTGQFPQVSDLTFWPLKMRSTGAELGFQGAYQPQVARCLFEYHRQAIDVFNCATPLIKDITALYCYGSENFKMSGNSSIGTYGTYITDSTFNNAWPLSPETGFSAWAFNKAFTTGQTTYVDGYILQCQSSGTTASSGTVSIPAADSYTWSTAFGNFLHGTATFRVICHWSLTHILQENYAHSLSMKTATCLNGAYGYRMADSANTGSSRPLWMDAVQLVSDHAYFGGVLATHGHSIDLGTGTWIGSTLQGAGITCMDQFKGPFRMDRGRIVANGFAGLNILAANNFNVSKCNFGGNGWTAANGTYNDIYVAPGIKDFDISHNHFGEYGGTANTTNYGIYVDAGASNGYIIIGNRAGTTALVSSVLFDGGTGTNKHVYHNLDIA